MRSIVVVNKYADDGTKNRIALNATLNAAYFSALINQADASKRWFIIKGFKNVTTEKGETIFEEFEDGSKYKIREGVRGWSGILPKTGPEYNAKLKGYDCSNIAIYIFDKDGNILGNEVDAGYLDPIDIDASSWNPVWMPATDTTISKNTLSFDWAVDQTDDTLRMITKDSLTSVNVLALDGLIDGYATSSSESTTGFTIEMSTDYGDIINPVLIKGLVAGDFALYNVTDSASITITSVTESSDGVYVFVIPTQTSADVLRLTPTKTGYDFSTVPDVAITIP